jgi:ubiquinone biosynthesis protein
MKMIFVHGFYHADPHPGNIVVLEGNVIGLIDFGMVGRIDERLREHIEEMLLAIVNHDVPMLTALIKRIGQVPQGLDEGALANDVADFVGHYATQSLAHFDMGNALKEIVEIIRRFHIVLPTQVALLLKVLITLEGTTKLLSPKFSLMEVMQPFRNRMLLQRLSPQRTWRKLRRYYLEFEQMLEVMPRQLANLLEQVQDGNFDVHLDHRGLGPSVNRLVLGMLSSALFMGSSLMLSYKVPPLLFPHEKTEYLWGIKQISILGLAGCMLSLLLGLRLIQAIGKSGHLDQKPK